MKVLIEKVFKLLLIVLAASLPYNIKISAFLTVMLTILWLVSCGLGEIRSGILKHPIFLMPILIFILSVFSLTYSASSGFFPIEKKLSLLVFPLIFSTIKTRIDQKLIFKILLSFVLSCTAGAAYSLALAINKPGPFGVDMVDITEMTNHAIGISHVYFNLYLGFCLIFICVFLFSEKRNSWFSVVLIPIGCFLLFFMFLLGGKMAIISLLILAVSTSGVLIVKKRKWVLGAALAIIPLAFFVFTILSVKDARARFEYLVNTENYFTGDNAWNSIGVRFSILKCVREVYLENPILGTGIGDVQNDLNECYEAKGYKTILDMNPHNQYFQFLLESGILGLVSYVLCILFIAIKANKSSNYLLSYFILMFSLCSLTESLLERQQGVMFFSYFLSFLACSFSSDPLKTSKTELKDGDIELNLRSVGEND